MVRRVDAIVVGAGINGAATAWWLARSGHDVVLLERDEPAHRGGSSHGGVRIFRFAYPDPDYVRLARRALELWRTAEDETGETLVELTGGLDWGDERVTARVAAALDAAGEPYEWLDAAAAAERWPQFRFETRVLLQPHGGRCFAERAVRALFASARAHGAEVRCGEAVIALTAAGDDAVAQTDRDEWRAPVCVVAAGAWTARLLDGLVALPPLTVTRERPVFFRPAGGEAPMPWPSFVIHGDGRGRPDAFESIACYGLAEPGVGIKIGEHHTGRVVDPDGPAEDDPDAVARVARSAQRWVPGVDPVPVAADACLYTSTADEDFVIDRRGPFTVVSACSGHGFKFGPATGELAARIALGEIVAPPRFALR